MAIDKYTFPALEKKQLKLAVPIYDSQEWNQLRESSPRMPRTFEQTRELAANLFQKDRRRRFDDSNVRRRIHELNGPDGTNVLGGLRGVIEHRIEECGESIYQEFFNSLGNPNLTSSERAVLEADMDADTPDFGDHLESDHFILRWTSVSENIDDNIADAEIVHETAEHLEHAWKTYTNVFLRTPFIPAGQNKIEVVFRDIAGFGSASPPEGPILFDSRSWNSMPGIRKPTSAHELFHKLQYSFGYRTRWTPRNPYKWFSEGIATWAEAFVWGQLSRDSKLTDLFDAPDANLFNTSYESLPFWIFFETRHADSPNDNLLVSFLEKCDLIGDERTALRQAISEDWPDGSEFKDLGNLFTLFSSERISGQWRVNAAGGRNYDTILGPDGDPISPSLTVINVPLLAGTTYNNDTTVSSLGSDYYRFDLGSDTQGHALQISIDIVDGGELTSCLAREKALTIVSTSFSVVVNTNFSMTEGIDLSLAENVYLIVSGRDLGGRYRISARVL